MDDLARRGWQAFARLDERFILFMRANGIRVLRYALAVVFVWFGALKVAGVTPVKELVASTVYWFDPDVFVPVLGAWEIVVGVGLLLRFALRFTLLLFWLQMAGTLLVLVMRPDVAFQAANPLLLTVEGEFVVKNLVLIAGGIVVGGTVRRVRGEGRPLTRAGRGRVVAS